MAIQLFSAPKAVKEGRDPGKSVELKIIRGRQRDVARIAQHVDDPHVWISEINLQLRELMVRFVAAKIGNPVFALDRDLVLAGFPEARDRTTNQLCDQAREPGAAALWIADHDDIFHPGLTDA